MIHVGGGGGVVVSGGGWWWVRMLSGNGVVVGVVVGKDVEW